MQQAQNDLQLKGNSSGSLEVMDLPHGSLAHPSADRLFCYAVHTATDGHSIALEFYYLLCSKIPATRLELFCAYSSFEFPGQ